VAERLVVASIRARLGQRHDLKLLRVNSGLFREGKRRIRSISVNGFPDLFAILNVLGIGVFVGIEAKDEGEKQRPEQADAQAVIESVGGIYFVAYSADEAEAGIEQARRRVVELIASATRSNA
jgi:hypothetical protein